MNDKQYKIIANVLDSLGAASEDSRDTIDSGETATIAKQLEYVSAKTFDVRYPSYKARSFIPMNSEVSNGHDTYTYRVWDEFGMAKLISDYADDLPNVDVTSREATSKFKSLGASFQYSIQDLRSSAISGAQLDTRRAMNARRRVEAKMDDLAAFGDAQAGLTGFTNNANVSLVTPDNGSWASATPQEMLEDLRKMQRSIVVTSKQVFQPDTLLLDTASFDLLTTTELSADNNTTVMEQFLKTSPYIRNVDQWHKLDNANASGNGPRCVMYARDPEVLEWMISQEYEQFPPQARNLAFVVNTHARVGSVVVRYPLGMAYMDGI